jgi:hypothetical protein
MRQTSRVSFQRLWRHHRHKITQEVEAYETSSFLLSRENCQIAPRHRRANSIDHIARVSGTRRTATALTGVLLLSPKPKSEMHRDIR